MAWDDPLVWVLIVAIVIFLFGSSRIPALAKGLGRAKYEFDMARKGIFSDGGEKTEVAAVDNNEPLLEAARKEGIDVSGKTKQQIASELSAKLNKQTKREQSNQKKRLT
jgi:sec-independent protein translocase protein TatA